MTYIDLEGIKRFHLIQLLSWQKTLAKRRHAQIDESVSECRIAETAFRFGVQVLFSYVKRVLKVGYNADNSSV